MITLTSKLKINKFDKDYFEFLFPQRTRLKTEYNLNQDSSEDLVNEALTSMMTKDYEMIKPFLSSRCENILDIGCGLGLIDIALYHHYEHNVNLYLLDKTSHIDEKTNIRGYNKHYVFYNSMEACRKTLSDNCVKQKHILTYEVSEQNLEEIKNNKYDLIISLLSCGWHFSINTYLDLIKKCLNTNGLLILDIRHNTGELELALENFELVTEIINTAESKHDGGTIGNRFVFRIKK